MTELVTRHFAKNKKKSEDAQDVKFDSHVRKFKPKMGHFWLAWASSNEAQDTCTFDNDEVAATHRVIFLNEFMNVFPWMEGFTCRTGVILNIKITRNLSHNDHKLTQEDAVTRLSNIFISNPNSSESNNEVVVKSLIKTKKKNSSISYE